MSLKRKFPEGFELELDENLDFCENCAYIDRCRKFKDPRGEGYEDSNFYEFCHANDDIPRCIKEGSIEKNLPWIIPPSDEEKLIAAISKVKEFCSSICLMECTEECPLKELKNEKL